MDPTTTDVEAELNSVVDWLQSLENEVSRLCDAVGVRRDDDVDDAVPAAPTIAERVQLLEAAVHALQAWDDAHPGEIERIAGELAGARS